ncbi:hypothetical protein DFH08DRAFT_1014182 [Mycena albidolilacea]|uniref:Cupin type-2 domain-containing protein n=1 Tax=Mycena albidolilacea TaxID=1033008 RepID=A0AAD7EM28_9AGAR|nr:hypothetical protein DFH08DRAFT_1014182 [Mycena albidolilacea]
MSGSPCNFKLIRTKVDQAIRLSRVEPMSDSWTLQDGISMTVLQNPLQTHILVTGVGEKLYVPPHWHAAHDEIYVVIKGRAIVTQDGVRQIVGPEDGSCLTRRGVIHSLEGFPGEELILEETTTAPEDTEQKIYFFRNLSAPGILRSPLGIMQVIVALGGWVAPFCGYQLPDKRLRLDPSRFPRDKKD